MIHEPHSSRSQPDDVPLAEQAAGSAQQENADTDEREIPLAPAPEPVHRWLDGEKIAPAELHAPDAEKHVKFWAKMNDETARRRRMATPRGLDAIIMKNLDPPVVKDD